MEQQIKNIISETVDETIEKLKYSFKNRLIKVLEVSIESLTKYNNRMIDKTSEKYFITKGEINAMKAMLDSINSNVYD